MNKFETWEELQKQYPDKWLILDAVYGTEGELAGGTVIEVCTDKTIDDSIIKYDELKKNYIHVRTSTNFNNGVQML